MTAPKTHDPHVIKKERFGGTRHGEVTYYAVGWQRSTRSKAEDDLTRFLAEDAQEVDQVIAKAIEANGQDAVRESWRQGFDNAVTLRGVKSPCRRCSGLGVHSYKNTSTWRGGAGGSRTTKDVCDQCWGSGDPERPWPSWRERESVDEVVIDNGEESWTLPVREEAP